MLGEVEGLVPGSSARASLPPLPREESSRDSRRELLMAKLDRTYILLVAKTQKLLKAPDRGCYPIRTVHSAAAGGDPRGVAPGNPRTRAGQKRNRRGQPRPLWKQSWHLSSPVDTASARPDAPRDERRCSSLFTAPRATTRREEEHWRESTNKDTI